MGSLPHNDKASNAHWTHTGRDCVRYYQFALWGRKLPKRFAVFPKPLCTSTSNSTDTSLSHWLSVCLVSGHGDVETWKPFPHWPVVRGIYGWQVDSPKVSVIQSFDVFFVVNLERLLNIQPISRQIEKSICPYLSNARMCWRSFLKSNLLYTNHS